MIHSLRPSRFAWQILLPLLLVLAMLPSLALASIPVAVDGKPLETVGPRMYRHLNESRQVEMLPDLAVSGQLLVQMWSSATPNDLQLRPRPGAQHG